MFLLQNLTQGSLLQNLIDLAGSESSKTETTGIRRKEGSYINKSLLTLGTVSILSDRVILSNFICVALVLTVVLYSINAQWIVNSLIYVFNH